MVLGGQHGDQVLPVAEGQHGDLRAYHTLLDDHGGAALAELVVLHHGAHGLLGLFHGGGYHHTLAQSQTVRLDYNGGSLLADVGQGLLHVGKGLVLGGRDVVLFHQFLRECFAGFQNGGIGPGTESRDASCLQGIYHSKGQGIIRSDHNKVHGVLLGPSHHSLYIGGLDGHTLGHLGNAPVAGGAVQLRNFGALGQLPADGVLTPASADD